MSHTYEKLSSNKAKLTFVIPAEQFDEAMNKAYLKNRGRINVPGFRKGKAPRKLIENMYGEGVFYDDALDMIFPEVYPAAIEAEGLQPVDRPEVDVQEIGSGKELKFTCEFFVRPDVELGQYKGLEVEVEKQNVTDDLVDTRIKQDQQKAARTIDVDDRAVENGDTVNLDYAGSVDGVAFEGGTAQGQTLVIGSNTFIPGFEEQMIGMQIGEEKDLNVTFPEQYHSEELAGKAAVFHVKVNGITVTEMPELDDDFAADVSDFTTFAEYKESIVKELTEKAEKNNDVTIENALVEKAVENATIDVPDAMIAEQTQYILREMEMRMMYQGLRMQDYMKYTGQTMEQLQEAYRGEAEKRVRVELTLEAIRKAEGIEPTEEEIAAEMKSQAERMGQKTEEFEDSLTEAQRGYIADAAAVQKVVALLKADAKVTEKKAADAE